MCLLRKRIRTPLVFRPGLLIMKTIVTHYAPDVDAVTSVWLLKTFLPEWHEADIAFVPAGTTWGGSIVDSDPEIFHVDTGLGMLDHHQSNEDTCAARKTLEYVKNELSRQNNSGWENEALERLVDVVNDIDHFREVYYPNPTADLYELSLIGIMDGWKLLFSEDSRKIAELSMVALDGIYRKFQDKIWAEKEIKEKGIEFKSKWGKGIGLDTVNDETVKLAQKMGYVIAVRKDPNKDYVRIKANPGSKVDLKTTYNKLRKKDRDATWYLHPSRKMILNGSMKNPETKATNLTLREIIEILRKNN